MQGCRAIRAGLFGALCLCSSIGTAGAAPTVTPSDGDARAAAVNATPEITPWQTIAIHAGDTLSGALARVGLGANTWAPMLRLKHADALRELRPGDTLDVRKTPDGRLAELRFKLDLVRTLVVRRRGRQLRETIHRAPTQSREITASGTIKGSVSQSLARQHVPNRIAAQLARIYRYRHNLRKLHEGDQFAVVYRAVYAHGKRWKTGPVIASSIIADNRLYQAFRAQGVDGNPGYFDAAGHSYKPAFTRKPVAYTRISSPFNLHRMNPVTHRIEPHKGVDMAAPTGTPIHAAADGVVTYAGWMHGYGRLVKLRNMDGYSTRYAHMHRIRKRLHVGQHVQKGEVIGYVGQSGEATGPHLHFEIRRHGIAHNPLTIKLPNGRALPNRRMVAFRHRIRPLIAKLTPAPGTLIARAGSQRAFGKACLGPNGFQNAEAPYHRANSGGILCLVRQASAQT